MSEVVLANSTEPEDLAGDDELVRPKSPTNDQAQAQMANKPPAVQAVNHAIKKRSGGPLVPDDVSCEATVPQPMAQPTSHTGRKTRKKGLRLVGIEITKPSGVSLTVDLSFPGETTASSSPAA